MAEFLCMNQTLTWISFTRWLWAMFSNRNLVISLCRAKRDATASIKPREKDTAYLERANCASPLCSAKFHDTVQRPPVLFQQ